jgi:ubiquinone/menaquinone biosynthesis C-methylase UbiE
MDAVFFFRSLHHVPMAAMDAALAEAARVLKPDGILCVIEPGMEGSHFKVMRPFHDETIVRTEAQAALARTTAQLFAKASHHEYHMAPRYPDFEAMVARVTGQTFNTISRDAVETAEVRALFETGRTAAGDYAFDQPMLLDLYQNPLPPLA